MINVHILCYVVVYILQTYNDNNNIFFFNKPPKNVLRSIKYNLFNIYFKQMCHNKDDNIIKHII